MTDFLACRWEPLVCYVGVAEMPCMLHGKLSPHLFSVDAKVIYFGIGCCTSLQQFWQFKGGWFLHHPLPSNNVHLENFAPSNNGTFLLQCHLFCTVYYIYPIIGLSGLTDHRFNHQIYTGPMHNAKAKQFMSVLEVQTKFNTMEGGIRQHWIQDHLCRFCYLEPSRALEDTNSPFHHLSQSGNQTDSEGRSS